MKRSGFGFETLKFQEPPKSFIYFRVTKKDPCLPFHFHILNLFKSLSTLGFDQKIQMGIKFIKNQNNEKQKHIVLLCHIVSIQVDKLTRFGHIQTIQIMYLPPNPKLCLMKSSLKRSGFGFQTWEFQNPPKSFILE
jgi:hypothetical protein